MTTYEALLSEILAIQAARNLLPSDSHVEALFELTILRLSEHAEANGQFMNGVWRERRSALRGAESYIGDRSPLGESLRT
jgi:hypothetical protein